MAPREAQRQEFWIWKALNRDSRQLLALERRHRDQAASKSDGSAPSLLVGREATSNTIIAVSIGGLNISSVYR